MLGPRLNSHHRQAFASTVQLTSWAENCPRFSLRSSLRPSKVCSIYHWWRALVSQGRARTVTLVHRLSRVASSRARVFLALQQTRPSLFLARLPLSLSLSLTFFFNGGARSSHSPFLGVFGDRSGAAEFASPRGWGVRAARGDSPGERGCSLCHVDSGRGPAVILRMYSSICLGTYLDRGLTWDNHVNSICSKLTSGTCPITTLLRYWRRRRLLQTDLPIHITPT